MQDLYQAIARMRHSKFPVLLLGESGTGKSLIAKVLHDFGDGASGVFRKITFSGMAASEMENIISGISNAAGDADLHPYSTLYLNEILEIPKSVQARLLQWLEGLNDLEEGQSVRIIASTSEDIETAVTNGEFREDLFYRLSVVPLRIPPLRERLEDVPDLARHFLKMAAADGAVANYIEPDGIALLKQHLWPGNVRELENLVHRICLLHSKETIKQEDINEQLGVRSVPAPNEDPENVTGFPSLREATRHFVDRYFDVLDMNSKETDIYQRFLG